MGSTIKALSLPYSHTWENFYKGIDSGGPYYRCSFFFPDWSQSDSIANQIMGYSVRSGQTNASGVSINVLAMNHPLSNNLYAVKCDIEGVGSPTLNPYNGLPWYNAGFLAHVEFRPWVAPGQLSEAFNQAIDPTTPILWCVQSLDFHTESFDVSSNSFVYSSDNVTVATTIPLKVNVTVMTLTWPRLPYIPMYWIKTLKDSVNKYTFLGCDPGTVLFNGGRTTRQWNTDGSVVQSVEMVFQHRNKPWNMMPRGGWSVWDTVQDQNGNNLYNSQDLAPLISL